MTIRKFLTTSTDTLRELWRTLDKLLVFFRFYFDHYAMSRYLNRWKLAEVGNQSWISTNVRIDLFKPPEMKGKPLVTIGNHCMISEYTQFITHDTSFGFFKQLHHQEKARKWAPIRVEDNVFIGAGCIILPGVTLRANSLIGAGSVVTKDTESGWVYAGNPAKKIITIDEYLNKKRS